VAFEDDLKRIADSTVAELTAAARQAITAARAEGLAEGRAGATADHTSDLAASERLLETVRAIDASRSLSEILDTLVSGAAREVARAGLLLVRGDRLRGWRFVGFPELTDGSSVDLALRDGGVIADAIRTRAAASGETGTHASPPPFASLPPGHESLAVPITMADEVVAVLYADQGDDESATDGSLQPPAWPERIEILTRHAARCLEALTAIKAAHALTERPADAATDDLRAVNQRPSDSDDGDASAQRYAKLLVSEIKLYHEADVLAGRRERDLATRLGGEIARARVLYEQRVPPTVRRRADYFFDELVRTLANGDATLLQLT
jgi:hypothetical protein